MGSGLNTLRFDLVYFYGKGYTRYEQETKRYFFHLDSVGSAVGLMVKKKANKKANKKAKKMIKNKAQR